MDITFHSRNLQHGHLSAPVEYFYKAFEEIEKKVKLMDSENGEVDMGDGDNGDNENNGENGISKKNIVYFVVSDNLLWAKRNLNKDNRKLNIL